MHFLTLLLTVTQKKSPRMLLLCMNYLFSYFVIHADAAARRTPFNVLCYFSIFCSFSYNNFLFCYVIDDCEFFIELSIFFAFLYLYFFFFFNFSFLLCPLLHPPLIFEPLIYVSLRFIALISCIRSLSRH
jgi:hypothetical protein